MKKLKLLFQVTLLAVLGILIGQGFSDRAGVDHPIADQYYVNDDRAENLQTVEESSQDFTPHQIASMERAQRASRASSLNVHVSNPLMGSIRGSGTYVNYKGAHLVITAAHVLGPSMPPLVVPEEGSDEIEILPPLISVRVRTRGDVYFPAHPIYIDRQADIAVLYLPNVLPDMTAAELNLRNSFRINIGDPVIYTGSPSHHERITIYGRVAGNEQSSGDILIHSYAWGGASGSGVFDRRGRLIGVLYGVDLVIGPAGIPTIVEDIVYISPLWRLNRVVLERNLERERTQ